MNPPFDCIISESFEKRKNEIVNSFLRFFNQILSFWGEKGNRKGPIP